MGTSFHATRKLVLVSNIIKASKKDAIVKRKRGRLIGPNSRKATLIERNVMPQMTATITPKNDALNLVVFMTKHAIGIGNPCPWVVLLMLYSKA